MFCDYKLALIFAVLELWLALTLGSFYHNYSGNISETVLDRDFVTAGHCIWRSFAIASLFKWDRWDVSFICARLTRFLPANAPRGSLQSIADLVDKMRLVNGGTTIHTHTHTHMGDASDAREDVNTANVYRPDRQRPSRLWDRWQLAGSCWLEARPLHSITAS